MSAEKKVITIRNKKLPISKCKKFINLWYEIGDINIENSGDCYCIDGKFYRVEANNIIYNHSFKKYQLASLGLIQGVIGINENNELIFGHFNRGDYSVVVSESGKYPVLDVDIFKNNKEYRERLSDGNFYHISKLAANKFNPIVLPPKEYKYSLSYDSKNIIEQNIENYNNYNPEISKNIQEYSKLLGNLSFGLEFETTHGFVPSRILNKYGLMPLRDGSISGIEYATVPMQGAKGLQCTAEMLQDLAKRTKYDDRTCSLHLHIGNIPRTKEFILAFLKVGMMIQDSMFKLFPLYKKYNYNFKNKNYSEPLPTYRLLSKLDPVITSENIDRNFGVIYDYFSMGFPFEDVDCNLQNVNSHPMDPNGNQKWQIKTRYHIFNIIPLLFGNKQTIEFRIHTPTYEVNKIIPFILMNSSIINFVIENTSKILNGDLEDHDLHNIVYKSINYSNLEFKYKDPLTSLFIDIFNIRESGFVQQTLKGNILGTESDIKVFSRIDWSKDIEVKENPYISFNDYKRFNIQDVTYRNGIDPIKSEKRMKEMIDQLKQAIDKNENATL